MTPIVRASRRRTLLCAAAGLASSLPWVSSRAQGFPDKAITVIVPWPAGGTADLVARVVTQRLAARFPKGVVVENRPGANGIIGAGIAANATPDGHTLFAASVETATLNPHVYPKLPYDPATAFVPVASIARSPYAFVGRSGLSASSMSEVFSLIRSQPGKLTYGSVGNGSVIHVAAELILGAAGRDVIHVPFNGGPPAYNALAGGHVDLMVLPVGFAPGFRSEGKIRIFAVTSAARLPRLEDVPTLKELGYDIEAAQVIGLLAPRGTPAVVLDLLNAEINAILRQPEAQAALTSRNAEAFVQSREQYASYLRSESERWGEVVRRANIKVDP